MKLWRFLCSIMLTRAEHIAFCSQQHITTRFVIWLLQERFCSHAHFTHIQEALAFERRTTTTAKHFRTCLLQSREGGFIHESPCRWDIALFVMAWEGLSSHGSICYKNTNMLLGYPVSSDNCSTFCMSFRHLGSCLLSLGRHIAIANSEHSK